MDILSYWPDLIPCLALLPPSEHRASFWSGWHNHAYPLLAQPFDVPWSQTLTDPPDEACPSQRTTTICSPRRCCFPFCQTPWQRLHSSMEIAVLQLTETVQDGLRRVSAENQGHQGHLPQHI